MKRSNASLVGKRKREDEDEMTAEEIFESAVHPLFWSDPNILSRVSPWLTVLEFGRVEQVCRGATIDESRWLELSERYFCPGIVPAIRSRFVEKYGGYRGLMRYEVMFVRTQPSESWANIPRLLLLTPLKEAPITSPENITVHFQLTAFGQRRCLRLGGQILFPEVKLFGGAIVSSLRSSFEDPFLVLGNASCFNKAFQFDVNDARTDARSCDCDDSSCCFANWNKTGGIIFRADLELPKNRMCSLQPPLTDCFYLDKDLDTAASGTVVSIDDSGRAVRINSPLLNEYQTTLVFRRTLTAARIQQGVTQGFGANVENLSLLYCPVLGRVDENKVGITGFYLSLNSFRGVIDTRRSNAYRSFFNNCSLLHIFEELDGVSPVATKCSRAWQSK